VYWQAPDGSAPAEPLTHESTIANPQSFSPDGALLVFLQPANPPYDLGVVTLKGPRRSELILHEPYSEANGAVSPDGRWLAYQSNESGRDEVYVRPFPDVNSGRWQVSVMGDTATMGPQRTGAVLLPVAGNVNGSANSAWPDLRGRRAAATIQGTVHLATDRSTLRRIARWQAFSDDQGRAAAGRGFSAFAADSCSELARRVEAPGSAVDRQQQSDCDYCDVRTVAAIEPVAMGATSRKSLSRLEGAMS